MILRRLAVWRTLARSWYTAGAMNGTQAEATLAQIRAGRGSTARIMNTHATSHAATATAMLNMATLVRENRVSAITIAQTITTAAVAAAGIANGQKWYPDRPRGTGDRTVRVQFVPVCAARRECGTR